MPIALVVGVRCQGEGESIGGGPGLEACWAAELDRVQKPISERLAFMVVAARLSRCRPPAGRFFIVAWGR